VFVIVVQVELKLEQADEYCYWQGMSGLMKIRLAFSV
jgi:hypothetical protein